MKSVVITGVSTGIGWSTTKILVEKGLRVFGSVRKSKDAERLQQEFGEGFIPLVFDVTDEAAVRAAAQMVHAQLQGTTLLGLVNNAGVAVGAPLLHLPIAEFRQQLEVNLVGVLIVTQAFAPLLGSDRSLQGSPGRIVNISSVAGQRGNPFMGAYVASKHGLEGLSESLRRELLLYGIDVIIVGPGAIVTPIWDKAEQLDIGPYAHTDYVEALQRMQKYMISRGRSGYPPEKVGQVIWEALTVPAPRVRYAVEPGNPIRNFIQSLLPKRRLDKMIGRGLGLIPEDK